MNLPALNGALQHPKCWPILDAPDAIEEFELGVQVDRFVIQPNDRGLERTSLRESEALHELL
jgi:hypothetical protein